MPTYKKQILAPGKYTVTRRDERGAIVYGDNGEPERTVFEVTGADLAALHHTTQQMKAAGVTPTVPLEHQELMALTRAERLANRVRFNTGFVRDTFIASDGSLWAELQVEGIPVGNNLIQDPAAITRFLTGQVRYVSPWIAPRFVDGSGREWKNAICHVALTSKPIWGNQLPFGSDGAALLSHVTPSRFPLAGAVSFSMPADFKETSVNPHQQLLQLVQQLATADLETQQLALKALQEIVGGNAKPEADTSGTAGGGGTLTAMSQEDRRAAATLRDEEKCGEEMARWALSR